MSPADRFKYFRVEARDLLEALQKGLAGLDGAPDPAQAARGLLRHAHTLKGAARVVRLPAVADLAHALEECLGPVRDGEAPSAEVSARAQALVDGIAGHLANLDGPPAPAPASVPASGPAPEAPPLRRLDTVRLELSELDALSEGLREAAGRLDALRADAAGLGRARRLAQALGARPGQDARGLAAARELDALLERLDRRAAEGLEQAGRELGQAQDRAAGLRLLPVSALFEFLERTCRDAAAAQGKRVRFEGAGGEQRLDGPLWSAMQEALQHVVRNAVVHGLETPAGRRAAGKAEVGRVSVRVSREGSRLRFHCSDDGRGLDLAALREAALRRGRLPAGAPDPLPADQAVALLLQGGLSTASGVSELAGRGLGLDVLRNTVEGLKGGLELRPGPGRGLELELTVPASLSAYPALAVAGGARRALLPFDAVAEAARLRREDLSLSPGGQAIRHDGVLVPYAPLAECLGETGASAPASVLFLRGAGGTVALGVDRVLGLREAVVRPLPALCPDAALGSGASLDETGLPWLVLEPEALGRLVRARRDPGAPAAERPRPPLLVVDDSLTTRMLEQGILETAGYTVDLAVSGEEGLERLRAKAYGLVLVDVEMPGMSGFEFCERLRADPALHGLPAVLVSSRASAEDRRRGLEAGARDYIVKGEFDQVHLLARIRDLLA